jgi:nitrogen regulatory protein PII
MVPVKRLEIVIDAVHLPDLLDLLRAAGAPGWTIFRNLAGMGDRGERGHDQPTDVLSNVYILIAASPEQTQRIAEALRPLLARAGGLCLICDATSLRH